MPKNLYPSRPMRARQMRVEEEQRKQRSTSPFFGTGMHPTADGGMQVDGTMDVGGTLNVAGELNVTGDTVIGGTLSLPNGIIDNDALTSPVYPFTAHADGSNFSLATGANVPKLTITITPPAGYTKALVMATANMNAKNTTGASDYAYLGMTIDGVSVGWSLADDADPGYYCSVSNTASKLLTGLSGSFDVKATGSTSVANWSADVNNTINLDAMVMFLR